MLNCGREEFAYWLQLIDVRLLQVYRREEGVV
jgi:hypothetical protein